MAQGRSGNRAALIYVFFNNDSETDQGRTALVQWFMEVPDGLLREHGNEQREAC